MVSEAPRPAAVRDVTHRRSGLSRLGTLALLAVVAVLVTVSIPRLRSFAANENEAEARSLACMLAAELHEAPAIPDARNGGPTIEALTHRGAIERALSDASFLSEGRLLRRHGYLFCVVRLDAGPPPASEATGFVGSTVQAAAPAPGLGVMAWPWQRGRTGARAWIATATGGLFQHENDRGQWDGPGTVRPQGPPPVLTAWNGWSSLPR